MKTISKTEMISVLCSLGLHDKVIQFQEPSYTKADKKIFVYCALDYLLLDDPLPEDVFWFKFDEKWHKGNFYDFIAIHLEKRGMTQNK